MTQPDKPDHHPGAPEQYGALLTVTEVASMLRVSKMTIYRLITDEHLPALRVGRSYRMSTTAVTHYLATQTTDNQSLDS